MGNFDVVPATAQVSFPSAGPWYNYAGADTLLATGSAQSLTLNPGEYRVYTSKNLKDTGAALPTTPSSPVGGATDIVIFPNPVKAAAPTVRINLPVAADLTISLYSLMGARLGSTHLGMHPAGQFTLSSAQLPLNPATLGPGAYQLRMDYGQQQVHRMFIVLR